MGGEAHWSWAVARQHSGGSVQSDLARQWEEGPHRRVLRSTCQRVRLLEDRHFCSARQAWKLGGSSVVPHDSIEVGGRDAAWRWWNLRELPFLVSPHLTHRIRVHTQQLVLHSMMCASVARGWYGSRAARWWCSKTSWLWRGASLAARETSLRLCFYTIELVNIGERSASWGHAPRPAAV